jgi:hypothetical protein
MSTCLDVASGLTSVRRVIGRSPLTVPHYPHLEV